MKHIILSVVAAVTILSATTVNGVAEPAISLRGNHPVAAETLRQVGRADPNQALHMSITFALRNRAELETLLSEQQNPRSPEFHHWLTPKEFNQRFGPREADINLVVDWLRREGFGSVSLRKDERYVSFTGTVAQAEHSFSVSISTFGHGRVFANVNDPLIPTRFRAIVGGIHGLDNMAHARPASTLLPQSMPTHISTGHGYANLVSVALSQGTLPLRPDALDLVTGPAVATNLGRLLARSTCGRFMMSIHCSTAALTVMAIVSR